MPNGPDQTALDDTGSPVRDCHRYVQYSVESMHAVYVILMVIVITIDTLGYTYLAQASAVLLLHTEVSLLDVALFSLVSSCLALTALLTLTFVTWIWMASLNYVKKHAAFGNQLIYNNLGFKFVNIFLYTLQNLLVISLTAISSFAMFTVALTLLFTSDSIESSCKRCITRLSSAYIIACVFISAALASQIWVPIIFFLKRRDIEHHRSQPPTSFRENEIHEQQLHQEIEQDDATGRADDTASGDEGGKKFLLHSIV